MQRVIIQNLCDRCYDESALETEASFIIKATINDTSVEMELCEDHIDALSVREVSMYGRPPEKKPSRLRDQALTVPRQGNKKKTIAPENAVAKSSSGHYVGRELIECEWCGFSYAGESGLSLHTKRMHPDQWVPKNPDKNFKEKQKRAIHKEHMRETAAIQAAARKVIVTEHERV